MKKISVVIPTYNEQDNVEAMHDALTQLFSSEEILKKYDYEILFIDNKSKDNTRALLTGICQEDSKVKAIFNAKNFGQFKSPYYGLLQSTGDCTILLCADFQDPLELIPKFVEEWENGTRIVIGIKTSSKENKLFYMLRSMYYKLIKSTSNVEQIEHFTGFGLYDRKFIEVLRELKDPSPFLRGIVAELGYDHVKIPYTQAKRRAGKTSNNLYTLYDAAMIGITAYTKVAMRIATFTGVIVSGLSVVIGIVYLVLKLMYWDNFPMGTAPQLIGMFFLGAMQLLFIGILGEYILSINTRVMNRPLVIEEKRLNFESDQEN